MDSKLLAFATFCVSLTAAGQTAPPREALSLLVAARQDQQRGLDARSEARYRQALAAVEKAAGPQTPALIPALNGLSELYFAEHRYKEAEALALRSAALVTAALGPEHPLLATSLNNLAAIYHVQGLYSKAEPLYLRALAIREVTLGPNHPFVAATLGNLAALDLANGNYARAAMRYARAARIEARNFGKEDARAVEMRANYALVVKRSRRAQAALDSPDLVALAWK
jgi:tetratricopeptide (TPR) repeat protein